MEQQEQKKSKWITKTDIIFGLIQIALTAAIFINPAIIFAGLFLIIGLPLFIGGAVKSGGNIK